jgi:hypothetical protein
MYDVMVDIDDVLFPLIDSIHDLAQERGYHDGSRPAEVWKGWEQYGIPEDVYWDLWADFALADGYRTKAPLPGAAEALRKLHFEGHRIHLVTARGFLARAEEIRAWTPEWLEEFAIPYDTLSFTHDKSGAQIELGVNFDFAFDDSPKNFQGLLDSGVNAYLVNHPHNLGDETIPVLRRVDSIAQGVDIVLAEWNELMIEEHAARVS